MSAYLGTEKQKINLGGKSYKINIFSALSEIKDVVLATSDNYILKDADGLYLVPKEDE